MVNKESVLFETGTNFIYTVYEADKIIDDCFLLYNSDIYRWITIDSIGKEIFEYIKKEKYVLKLMNYLISKYNIDNETLKSDVFPMLNFFVDKKFLTENTENKKIENLQKGLFDIHDGYQYPFNEMYIGLTDSCNLNCIYCFNKERRKKRTECKLKDMDTETIISAMEQFKDLGGKGIVFTGGEPTLHKSLIELCKAGNSLGLSMKLITNGTNLNNIDLYSLTNYISDIGVSLDSIISNEINDLWGKNKEHFLKNVDSAFKILNDISKKNKINITIMPIISKVNMGSLPKLIYYVNHILNNCEISWNFTQYDSIEDKKVDIMLDVTKEEYEKVIFNCGMEIMKNELTKVNTYSIEQKQLFNRAKLFALSQGGKKLPGKYPKIISCAPSFFVNTKGEVYACQGFESPEGYLGNIRKDTLRNMFNGKSFSNVRKKLFPDNNSLCRSCELKSACMFRCAAKDKENLNIDCKKELICKMYLQSIIS